MSLTLADTYLLKALICNPFKLDNTIEALQYALGHDDEHAGVHCLYGRIYTEQLNQYKAAQHHFELALLYDPFHADSYGYYLGLMHITSQLKSAELLVEKAIKIRGVNKLWILHSLAIMHEGHQNYVEAKKLIKQALRLTSNQTAQYFLKCEQKRIVSKLKKRKNKEECDKTNYLTSTQVDCAIG